jgi:hypothetical protein
MPAASAWAAAPHGTHVFSPEEVTGLLVHQGIHIDAVNTRLDALQADQAIIRNFILDGYHAPLPAISQPTLQAPSVGFSTPANARAGVSAGVPIHRLSFPPSPSRIPPWVLGATQGTAFSSLSSPVASTLSFASE